MLYVLILEDDGELKTGDIYEAEAYWLDPSSKYSLIQRVPDGYDPSRNVYRESVAVSNNMKYWRKVEDGYIVEMSQEEVGATIAKSQFTEEELLSWPSLQH